MRVRPALVFLLALVLAGPARAGIPDPRNCIADTCLVVSPAGLFAYSVTVRDASLAPVDSALVVLDFGTAPGLQLCSVSDPDLDRRVWAMTNSSGQAVFHVRGGGQTTGYVVVSANAQTILVAYPRSTDLNGDLAVSSADVTLHAALPANARAGNYDCDGDSDSDDRARITAELGQDCSTVPVINSTWGALKASYR